MFAMILAAGRGHRMGELTQVVPKPLLRVGNNYLIEYAIFKLIEADIRNIVINLYYHGEKIKAALGNGENYGARFLYSEEEERLEVGGGIVNALKLLGDEPFIVISSDILTDFSLRHLPKNPPGLGHIVMVDNPSFHQKGDFGLTKEGRADRTTKPFLTYANMGIYRKELFNHVRPQFLPFHQLLFPAIENNQIWGEHFKGTWFNIGTPQDLELIRTREDLHRSFIPKFL